VGFWSSEIDTSGEAALQGIGKVGVIRGHIGAGLIHGYLVNHASVDLHLDRNNRNCS
jgi:hypothetical protein